MQFALNPRCQAVALAGMMAGSLATPAAAVDYLSPKQQNTLVQKYCAVCHTDTAKNGGLSLEYFDASQAPPSLTAMLLSKLTGGVSLKTAREASFDAGASELIERKMRSGAMGASGIPIPDKATIDALIRAFTLQSAGALDWTVQLSKDAVAGAPMLTASILREAPSATNPGEAEFYRLVASCNLATQVGSMQLAWSPVPQSGNLAVLVDGSPVVQYRVEGSEKMGNSSGVVLHQPAALVLAESQRGVSKTNLPFPAESLTIRDLFPGETVTFPFANLPKDARQELNTCFSDSSSGRLK